MAITNTPLTEEQRKAIFSDKICTDVMIMSRLHLADLPGKIDLSDANYPHLKLPINK